MEPVSCESKLCCKATAQLAEEINKELCLKDKCIAELLEGKPDEDQDSQG